MYKVSKTKVLARGGELTTDHGVIQTPFFMPIATKGAVKTLSSLEMKDLGAQILLSNTYHLMLRPGLEAMKRLGGLHKLMNWEGPILTDSGGYQVFSLGKKNVLKGSGTQGILEEEHRSTGAHRALSSVKISEDGVEFRSPIDGDKHLLTPELSMQMQSAIGSDVFMQFDDVAAGDSSRERYEEAMERSVRWAERCKEEFQVLKGSGAQGLLEKENPSTRAQLFGIIQGGTHEDLRERSLEGLKKIGFDGYAIGGLSVGEAREDAYRIVKHIASLMPEDKPRYFMGGGFPEEIVYYVSVGVDMFDCVIPTRNARHGTLFLWAGDPAEIVPKALEAAQNGASDKEVAEILYTKKIITNEEFAFDNSPIDPWSDSDYSKAYLRHLFRVDEDLGKQLATKQNLRFYLRLMQELRNAIA